MDKNKIVGDIVVDSLNPDARPIGDVAGRWISPDPLSEEFPEWSPYNFCFDNPLKFVDPDGRAAKFVNPPDDVTINSSGNVINVVKKEGPNRFFDQNGIELNFNDPKITDKHMVYGHFEKGDNIFKPITNLTDIVIEAGTISPNVSESYKSGADYVRLGIKSWGSWDFPYVLKDKYNVSDDEMNKAGYEGGCRTYFRFWNS